MFIGRETELAFFEDLFAKNSFSQHMLQAAGEDQSISLVTLADILSVC